MTKKEKQKKFIKYLYDKYYGAKKPKKRKVKVKHISQVSKRRSYILKLVVNGLSKKDIVDEVCLKFPNIKRSNIQSQVYNIIKRHRGK